ncbi:MAG: hypothetical protein CFH19_01301 [Alphaproteobacteria bacterium MarineAlpha5_Bin9]|nr:MAG: hypothetical protein CFH19_01301 [Alphaproteobacteria bacterium MarineAlpha5_Bin9]|tara:strand:+ start:9838 stop:10245 length:408 start_codon:yes stop_codon:yes gene_type:complete
MIENTKPYTKIKISSEKNFGYTFAFFFLIISLYLYIFRDQINIWLLFITLLFFVISFFVPKFLYYPNLFWNKLSILLGNIVSPLVMLILYFLVLFPSGIFVKILRKDLLNKKINFDKKSYWIINKEDNHSMKDQF